MNNKTAFYHSIKLFFALAIIALFFLSVFHYATLMTISPDSVRFMHFWQVNIDNSLNSPLKVLYLSLRESNLYDLSRGRVLQYLLYGLDSLTRWLLPSSSINMLMILLLIINSALISWVSTISLKGLNSRANLFYLFWLVLGTSSFIIAPALVTVLYAKYLWVTFILAFFAVRGVYVKVICLCAAAFSDEIGLFAVLIIIFLKVLRFYFTYKYHKNVFVDIRSREFLKACLWGLAISFTAFFAFYGILSVGLGAAATGFRGLAVRIGQKSLHEAGLWLDIKGLLWRAEVLILGLSFGATWITVLAGGTALGVILTAFLSRIKKIFWPFEGRSVYERFLFLLGDERGFFYFFWMVMLVLIGCVILPGGVGDFTHYSYPTAAVLSVLLGAALVDLYSPRTLKIVLSTAFVLHCLFLPRAVRVVDDNLGQYLFPDGTVSRIDMDAIQRSFFELRTQTESSFFKKFNNGQEIDFSGTWFYSRIKMDSRSKPGPYLPIQGTVRVLSWPYGAKSFSSLVKKSEARDY